MAFANLPVHGINPGGVDPDHNFSLARVRLRGILVYKDFRAAVRIDADCLHGFHERQRGSTISFLGIEATAV
jgi:hypothetical protein